MLFVILCIRRGISGFPMACPKHKTLRAVEVLRKLQQLEPQSWHHGDHNDKANKQVEHDDFCPMRTHGSGF
ncbi:hypothetical protein [Caudoviricetes sp.]|nr:hypothetical protein [Caudoviricetes sp.]